ncbi:hypothetical protein G4B88_001003 [Cannabis sativa]|uniref:Reverse transcriptase zinc-binding domain-containing protein n=1 Tax=Cannabis sativa TaxID=3483 RepID=A0A7J6FDZ1_CANSA|nr:hypothetical protein G4B88_001003 [Cannabis sativa]
MDIDVTCPMCNLLPETSLHLFVDCTFAQDCWRKTFGAGYASVEGTFACWFDKAVNNGQSDNKEDVVMLC